MMDAMSAQEAIQPRLLALERQYVPLYQDLQNDMLNRGMGLMANTYRGNMGVSADLSRDYALAMSPAYGAIGDTARGAYNQTLDPSVRGILGTLGTQAQGELALGSSLSPQETALAQQSARAAMASRGMQFGNQAAVTEALNSYNLGRQREDARRKFAGSVYGMAEGSAANAMQMYGAPLLAASNAYSPVGMYERTAQMQGGLGPQIFQPESQYNAQLITSNRQEEMQARIATSQARAGLMGGLMKMGGAILGGPIGGAIGGGLSSMFSSSNGAGLGLSKVGQMGSGPNYIGDNDMAY